MLEAIIFRSLLNGEQPFWHIVLMCYRLSCPQTDKHAFARQVRNILFDLNNQGFLSKRRDPRRKQVFMDSDPNFRLTLSGIRHFEYQHDVYNMPIFTYDNEPINR